MLIMIVTFFFDSLHDMIKLYGRIKYHWLEVLNTSWNN